MPGLPIVDEISPESVGEDRIKLRLPPNASPRAFHGLDISVDYSACAPDGIVLPLEYVVVAPSRSGCRHDVYRRTAPEVLTFRPEEGGQHLILLRESFHNRWFGMLRIDVQGDRLHE